MTDIEFATLILGVILCGALVLGSMVYFYIKHLWGNVYQKLKQGIEDDFT